jgi:site-specific DNA-methyltransferase (adenine-specific)
MKPYYSDKRATIYHAHWREAIDAGVVKERSVGMVCADPPYGTTNLSWDKKIDWRYFWPCVEQLCKAYAVMAMFSSGKFTHELIATNEKNFRYELIWEKPMPVGFLSANRRPLRAHENVLIFAREYKRSVYNPQFITGKIHKVGGDHGMSKHYGNRRSVEVRSTDKWHPRSILRFGKGLGDRGLHPTQKPLDLISWLIKSYSNRGQLIADFFCGSGTTLVAAVESGRRAIGVDSSEASCEVSAQRLMKANSK